MKKIILPIIIMLFGVYTLLDWIIYSTYLSNKGYEFLDIREAYHQRLPELLKPIHPIGTTFISMGIFILAGLLFIREKTSFGKAAMVMCFIFAFWMLWSLM